MAVQTVPYALQNASHSAALFRQSASAAFTSGGALSSVELAVRQQASPNMSVILGPGRAKVVGTSVSPPAGQSFTTQAMYDTLNDADLTLTIAAANPTNPRIDLVYIQVQDSFYSGASNQAIAGVVTGTPAAIPTVPATPTNAVAIATVAVAAAATSIVNANIARVITAARVISSGVTVADLDALAALTGASAGNTAWVTELSCEFIYSGSAWLQVGVSLFSSAATRDTAYNKAAGVYKVAGRAQVYRTDTGYTQAWNGTIWRYLNAGLIPVIPTGAVNATIGAGGVVTFSAVTSVNINGCFTTEYDNYVLEYDITANGAGTASMVLRVGGVDATTNYDSQRLTGSSSTAASAQGLAGASWPVSITGLASRTIGTIKAYTPALALATLATLLDGQTANPMTTTAFAYVALFQHRALTAYDGFTITMSAGTMTGNIRIYGYNNN